MAPCLQASHLAIGYKAARNTNTVIAKDLNLSLKRGEFVCLLGPNGAGKSTLMRTLAGMQPALSGQVLLAGTDVATLTPRERATRISLVLTERPDLGLLNGYALVALGRYPHTNWTGRLSPHDEAMVRWAIQAVGATELAPLPVMELSDGQRQKLMIARALAQESRVMLLDEPTAYLDLPHRAEIMQRLRHLAHENDYAILLSIHDLDMALRLADVLWLMVDGEIRVGTPEDLVLNGDFEAAFRSEGVTFDRATGTFRTRQDERGTVAILGSGITHMWTCRAVERAGFAVVQGDAPIKIRIIETTENDSPRWHLQTDTTTTTHHSIAALLTALSQL